MTILYKELNQNASQYFDWSLPSGASISSSTWSAIPSGLTLFGAAINGVRTSTEIAGGVIGVNYTLTNTIATTAGVSYSRTAALRVAIEQEWVMNLLTSIIGGEEFDLDNAREIVEGWVGRLKAANGGIFVDEPFARSVVRKGAKAEIWAEILRQDGYLAADETIKEEDKAEKLLKEYDASISFPAETNQRITTRLMARG